MNSIAKYEGRGNKTINETGNVYDRLTVIELAITRKKGSYWLCLCECGNTKIAKGSDLRRGFIKSCGCLKKELRRTHGLRNHELYDLWCGIKKRCYGPKSTYYCYYGGRGILVCDEWKDNVEAFIIWATSNGYHKGLEIDRIDNNGPYSPENCRFVSKKMNCRNTRRNRIIEYDGREMCVAEFIETYLSCPKQYVYNRLNQGWSPSQIIAYYS